MESLHFSYWITSVIFTLLFFLPLSPPRSVYVFEVKMVSLYKVYPSLDANGIGSKINFKSEVRTKAK